MSTVIECPDCEGYGSTERLTGHDYGGMGGGKILSVEERCETCDGEGVRPCEHCDEPAEVQVEGMPLCAECAVDVAAEVAS